MRHNIDINARLYHLKKQVSKAKNAQSLKAFIIQSGDQGKTKQTKATIESELQTLNFPTIQDPLTPIIGDYRDREVNNYLFNSSFSSFGQFQKHFNSKVTRLGDKSTSKNVKILNKSKNKSIDKEKQLPVQHFLTSLIKSKNQKIKATKIENLFQNQKLKKMISSPPKISTPKISPQKRKNPRMHIRKISSPQKIKCLSTKSKITSLRNNSPVSKNYSISAWDIYDEEN